jgi:hypothetical protein
MPDNQKVWIFLLFVDFFEKSLKLMVKLRYLSNK